MKALKNKWVKLLLSVLVILLGVKVYFEINVLIYEDTIKVLKEKNELLAIPKSKIVMKKLEVNNFNIHYFVAGAQNKDVIVFLHPAFSDHNAFEQQIDFFLKNIR